MSSYTSLAFTTVVITVGATQLKRLSDERKGVKNLTPLMTPVFGGFVLGLFLFAFGMVSERLAKLFCILIIVGALTWNGTAALEMFQALTPKTKKG